MGSCRYQFGRWPTQCCARHVENILIPASVQTWLHVLGSATAWRRHTLCSPKPGCGRLWMHPRRAGVRQCPGRGRRLPHRRIRQPDCLRPGYRPGSTSGCATAFSSAFWVYVAWLSCIKHRPRSSFEIRCTAALWISSTTSGAGGRSAVRLALPRTVDPMKVNARMVRVVEGCWHGFGGIPIGDVDDVARIPRLSPAEQFQHPVEDHRGETPDQCAANGESGGTVAVL